MGYQVISLKQSRYMKAVQCLLKNLKLIFYYSSSGRQVFRKSETGTAVSEHRQWFHGGHRTKQDGSHCQLTQLYRKCTLRTGQLWQGAGTASDRLQPWGGTVRERERERDLLSMYKIFDVPTLIWSRCHNGANLRIADT